MKFDNLEDCIKWVRLHTPFAIKPVKKAKTIFVNPFTSVNAFNIVTECIGKELYNQLQNENNLTK